MSSAVFAKLCRLRKQKKQPLGTLERQNLFGQFVILMDSSAPTPKPVYMLLTNQDVSFSVSRETQSIPLFVIKYDDILVRGMRFLCSSSCLLGWIFLVIFISDQGSPMGRAGHL